MNDQNQTPPTAATDPALPLPDATQEAFAHFAACGGNRGEAYERAQGRRMKKVTRDSQASRWSKIPEIAARMRYLQIERARTAQTAATPPAPATETQAERKSFPMPPQPPRPDSDPLTKEEIVLAAARLIRSGSSSDAQAAATLLHRFAPEIAGDSDDTRRRPSPDAIVRYLSTWSASPIGLDDVVTRLARIHTWAELLKAVRKGRQRERNRRKSMIVNASPSDSQSDATPDPTGQGEGGAAAAPHIQESPQVF